MSGLIAICIECRYSSIYLSIPIFILIYPLEPSNRSPVRFVVVVTSVCLLCRPSGGPAAGTGPREAGQGGPQSNAGGGSPPLQGARRGEAGPVCRPPQPGEKHHQTALLKHTDEPQQPSTAKTHWSCLVGPTPPSPWTSPPPITANAPIDPVWWHQHHQDSWV